MLIRFVASGLNLDFLYHVIRHVGARCTAKRICDVDTIDIVSIAQTGAARNIYLVAVVTRVCLRNQTGNGTIISFNR